MRNILAAITLMTVLMVGSAFAKGGLLVSDLTGSQQPCSTNSEIIVPTGFSIIVPTGFSIIVPTGIIDAIAKEVNKESTDCIIVPIG